VPPPQPPESLPHLPVHPAAARGGRLTADGGCEDSSLLFFIFFGRAVFLLHNLAIFNLVAVVMQRRHLDLATAILKASLTIWSLASRFGGRPRNLANTFLRLQHAVLKYICIA
jgi:hypothetical protein